MSAKYEKKIYHLYQRYLFNKTVQEEHEGTQDYLSRLRSLASRCCFGSTVEDRLRDQFILGLRDPELHEEIFYRYSSNSSTLSEISEATKDLENTKSNIDTIHNNVQFKGSVSRLKGANDKYSAPTEADKNKTMVIDTRTTCLRCGNKRHREGATCPAIQAECYYCRKIGHFGKGCLRAGTQIKEKIKQPTNNPYIKHDYFINTFRLGDNLDVFDSNESIKIDVLINQKPVKMIVDTGASISCVGPAVWESLSKPSLMPRGIIKGYGNNPIRTLGTIMVEVKVGQDTSIASRDYSRE
ncbi:hypothetical protein RF11_14762 [Thelohanellus kitauei]|uniref:CCHC-type domain-containing protein n=1 Tax=Thelohanellus kitauei TaxID=669202 RepID=A0A0C2JXR0_THEKT|nr:hypothetical protein RF11_14762 [Thelohanellus kitauei]